MDSPSAFRVMIISSALAISACQLSDTPAHQTAEQAPVSSWTSQYQQGEFQAKKFESRLSKELQGLVEEALQNNPQLQQQGFALDQQLYQLQIQRSQEWPNIDAFVSGQRSGTDSDSAAQFRVGVDFSWEIDWLGKLDARTQAAALDAKVAFENWQEAQISLATQVSQAWYNLLENQLQLQLVEERASNQQANLDIVENGYQSGLNEALDVYLGRAELNGVQAQLKQRQQVLKQAQQSLELLLGRYPEGTILAQGELAVPLPRLPAGVPSELIQRRHDIRSARYQLAAADLRVYAAYRDRFPSLVLTASGGGQSSQLNQLLNGESLVWSVFAGITTPLFDAQRLESTQFQQYALAQSRNAAYLDTVLSGFAEVEQALFQEPLLADSADLLAQAADDSEFAEQLAFEDYQLGLNGYVTVLESQRRAFDARSSAISALNQQVQNRIQLYLALGGGLEQPQLERPGLEQRLNQVKQTWEN